MNVSSKNHNALIITFEGMDCSFKETNSKKLKKYLEDKYPEKNVYLYSFPNYDSQSSYFLIKWLNGNYNNDVSMMSPSNKATFISTLYALDRFDTFNEYDIRSKINNENNIIIFDRYTLSNVYYQTSFYPVFDSYFNYISLIDGIVSMEHNTLKLPIEDITIFIRTPFDMIINKLKGKKEKDQNELNIDFLKRVFDNINSILNIIKSNNACLLSEYRKDTILKEIWTNKENTNEFRSEDEMFDLIISEIQPEIDNFINRER